MIEYYTDEELRAIEAEEKARQAQYKPIHPLMKAMYKHILGGRDIREVIMAEKVWEGRQPFGNKYMANKYGLVGQDVLIIDTCGQRYYYR